MNDMSSRPHATKPIDYPKEIPEIVQTWIGAEAQIANGVEAKLKHLIKLRASQMNGCAFCVKMHTHEARKDGETNERLDRLVVWRHVSDYSPAEKAALAWTEALTELDPRADLAKLRAELRAHFNEKQAAAITASVAMINLWNRMAISGH